MPRIFPSLCSFDPHQTHQSASNYKEKKKCLLTQIIRILIRDSMQNIHSKSIGRCLRRATNVLYQHLERGNNMNLILFLESLAFIRSSRISSSLLCIRYTQNIYSRRRQAFFFKKHLELSKKDAKNGNTTTKHRNIRKE